MKAIIDAETCIGCGLCPQVCPTVFKMEYEKAIVYTDPVPETELERCRSAANQCPVSAIDIQE